ncbi:MAG TPA: dephospho-CoA kinase [Armatimonadota bacterium]|jgi:dephospho-CoA kinase
MVLGVTGGIASGKSTVLRMLAALGAETCSADDLSRELTRPGEPTLEAIVRHFGPAMLREDGSLDRARLAGAVFADPDARRGLEAILHPPILQRLQALAERDRAAPPNMEKVLALEIPLLYEVGCEGIVDRVLVVVAEHVTQIKRLKQRTGWPDGQVQAAVASQLPLSHKAARADYLVSTDGSLQDTEEQVRRVWLELGTPSV